MIHVDGVWLLQQLQQGVQQVQRTLPDTIVTKQVAEKAGWFTQLASIASGLMSLALLVLTVALVPAAWNFRKSYGKINNLLEKVYGDINPLMRHASGIADNLDYITTAIRTDVQRVNATIATANTRLQEAVALTEERLQSFNALLDVVQREAEDMFVTTASTVRGMRTSVATLRDDVQADLAAEDDVLDLEIALDEGDDLELEEIITDGDQRIDPAEPTGPARPRVRPRSRRRES